MTVNLKYLFVLMLSFLLAACAGGSSHRAGTGSNEFNAIKDRARAHTDLGAAYLEKNKLEIALDEFSQATQIMPTYALAYTGLALVRAALGQDEEAEYNFKKSINLDPTISGTYNNYGTFLCARGRYDESIEQFMNAIKNPLYPTPNIAYANAGICAERKKDIQTAEVYLKKALEIQPLTHSAAHRLAEIQFARGEVVLAKKTLRNAIVASPSAEVLWLGVRIARKLEDKNNESSYALELRRRYPNSKETQLLLNKS